MENVIDVQLPSRKTVEKSRQKKLANIKLPGLMNQILGSNDKPTAFPVGSSLSDIC
jgi:UDP-N-acetylglucosamine pyrophosphorylase